ncbi:MAG: hypothetical protein GF364_03485 [Candidatus Lokiarchaeota archaeon]|nr:hypothetical protein [Candidatus Lokiarchaeota archaeon]
MSTSKIKIIGMSSIILGTLTFAVVIPFVHLMSEMDNKWFTSRYGPESTDMAYKTYENLYNMTLNIINTANKRLLYLEITLGTAFILLGIILTLLSKDRKKAKIFD